MGIIREVKPAALVAGIFYSDEGVYSSVMDILCDRFGSVEMKSTEFDFDMTDYYTGEMGENLVKRFVCFSMPIRQEELSAIKLFTNDVEASLARRDGNSIKRRINIDPGYVTMAKLVLATTKDYSHRIYIGDGIYAETTLRFLHRSFVPHDTTFPDYQTPLSIDFFNSARDFVKRNMHQWTQVTG